MYCENQQCAMRSQCKKAQRYQTNKQRFNGQGFNAVPCPDYEPLMVARKIPHTEHY